jgi:hypothetical protein
MLAAGWRQRCSYTGAADEINHGDYASQKKQLTNATWLFFAVRRVSVSGDVRFWSADFRGAGLVTDLHAAQPPRPAIPDLLTGPGATVVISRIGSIVSIGADGRADENSKVPVVVVMMAMPCFGALWGSENSKSSGRGDRKNSQGSRGNGHNAPRSLCDELAVLRVNGF